MPDAPRLLHPRRLLHAVTRPRGFLLVAAGGGVGWMLTAFWLVPGVIRRAHAGTGPAILDRLMSGRDSVPVETYLAAWANIAGTLTVTGAVLVVAAGIVIWQRARLAGWARRAHDSLARWGGPGMSAGDLLAAAATIAAASGLLEALAVLARQRFTAFPGWRYSRDVVWMAPSALAVMFLLAGLGWLAVTRKMPALRTYRVVIVVLVASGCYGVLQVGFSRLYSWASLLLALGIGVQFSGLLLAHRPRALVATRRTALGLPVVVAAIAGVTSLRAGWSERGALNRPAASSHPNVLLLVFDTVRAAALSTYGYARATSPNLDSLAAEGVTFDWALAPAPWTLPSHATLFTGYHYDTVAWDRPLDWTAPTLAEVLSDHGYLTAGFMANPHYGPEYYGLQRGFHRYVATPASWFIWLHSAHYTRALATAVLDRFGPQAALAGRRRADDINREFIDWLDDIPDRPFFGFLNYIDAHDPYLPPPPYDTRFVDTVNRYRLSLAGYEYTAAEITELRNMYDASVAYADAALGRLVDTLRSRGILDNTILIVTSDHGEEFAEHRVMGHSMSLYVPSLHVPLVIRFPASVPRGRRVPIPVGLRNIAATVTDLAGLEDGLFPGAALRRTWSGQGFETEPIFSHLIEKVEPIPDWYPAAGGAMRSVVLDGYHYIEPATSAAELYELASDPWERRDLAGDPAYGDILQRARSALDREALTRQEPQGRGDPPRVGRARRLGGD